jgi:hypothetical protein
VAVKPQPRTARQNAWTAVLGVAGLCALVLVLAVVLGLVGGLAWSLFQTMWEVFG